MSGGHLSGRDCVHGDYVQIMSRLHRLNTAQRSIMLEGISSLTGLSKYNIQLAALTNFFFSMLHHF